MARINSYILTIFFLVLTVCFVYRARQKGHIRFDAADSMPSQLDAKIYCLTFNCCLLSLASSWASSSSFEGYPLQVRHKQDWGRGFILLRPRLLHCLNQMLAVMSLSQDRVSSSKTVRPRAPCGARCIGHAVSTWSAVCSEAPHSQFGEGARPHLCMDEWNRPIPVRRRLSLTQAARGNAIPTGLALVPGTKARSLEAFSQYSVFHL